jgi:hypothetical protein
MFCCTSKLNSRTTNPSALSPSSKLLGNYHSSALRTDKPTLYTKPWQVAGSAPVDKLKFVGHFPYNQPPLNPARRKPSPR